MKIITIKKRFVTLIEMMIVMFLIALITGALAWNFGGALDKGKVFKTRTNIERLESILLIAAADHPDFFDDIESNWKDFVKQSPLVQNPNTLMKDAWGQEYKVTTEDGDIQVRSDRLDDYIKNHPTMFADGK